MTIDATQPDFDVLRERAYNLRWASVDPDVIPLTAADPDLPVASVITAAIADYVRAPHLCYGPALGLPAFRAAIARHFAQEKNALVHADRVIATNSAASALALVARQVLRAGDEVIVQDPVDFLLGESARRAGATLREWRADEHGRFTIEALRALVTPATRAISVCHPHNPLGTLWTRDEVQAISAFARERGLTVISDEVWSDVLLDGAPFHSFAGESGEHWIVYGLSKGFGLAGLRIGAVVAPDAARAEAFAAAQGFHHTIEGAATLSQVAAVAALEHAHAWRSDFLVHCQAQRDLAFTRLNALKGVRIARKPQATFVLFADIRATGLNEEELGQRIERFARVRVVPGSPRWFGAEAAGHIRLSLATTHAVLDEALTRLERAWSAITA